MTALEVTPATTPVDLTTGWGFHERLHGGYLLAVVTEAALRSADPERHPHPVAVQATYAAAPSRGPAEIVVRPLKAGRTYASLHASLVQDGRPTVEVLVTAGRLPELEASALWDDAEEPMPDLADPDHCVGGPHHEQSASRTPSGVHGDMTVRMDPAWASPPYGPGGRGDIRGWVRCAMPDPVLGALVLADALPPITFDIGMGGVWVPTLQLQVLLRRVPPTGWLAARQWGTLLAGELLDETCTLWDPQGRVVAQARQLAAYRAPRS